MVMMSPVFLSQYWNVFMLVLNLFDFILSMSSRRRRSIGRRFGRAIKTVSYNNQTVSAFGTLIWPANAEQVPLDKFILIQNRALGDVKVKNFSLKIQTATFPAPVIFALVYVPAVMAVESLDLGMGVATTQIQLYAPAQHVIMSGSLPHDNSTPMNFHSRLARNLEPGDRIVLILKGISGISGGQRSDIIVLLNYVVTVQ
jgi:hypothetical protein